MPVPRGLFLGALLWIVAAFLVTIGSRAPIQPTSGVYAPAVRGMLALLLVGSCILWPIARISLSRGQWSAQRILLDAAVIIIAFEGVFWPLHLVTHWSMQQALSISVLYCAWTLSAAAMMVIAMKSADRRTEWLLVWLAVCLTGALLDMVGVRAPIPAMFGPFAAFLALAPPQADSASPVAWAIASWPVVVAAILWAAALRTGSGRSQGVAPRPRPR